MTRDQYFRELVAMDSPPLSEAEVSLYIREKMLGFGYLMRMDETGNLLFYRDEAAERIMLSGHMDTVKPAIGAVLLEDDSRYYTDGTTALGADDKCALAVMLEKAEHYDGNRLAFLYTVAEEIGLYGSARLRKDFFAGLSIASAYVLDAEKEIGGIINEASGKSRIKVRIQGKSAHAGFNPEDGVSAIVIGSKIIAAIPHGRIDDKTTLNIGSFIAEGSTNVVPEKAEFTLEIRSQSDSRRKELTHLIVKTAETIAAEEGGSAFTDAKELYSHYIVREDSATVLRAAAAMDKAGIRHHIGYTMGGSDANNLNKLGIETIVIASGYFNAHSRNEYLDKKEFSALAAFTDAVSEL